MPKSAGSINQPGLRIGAVGRTVGVAASVHEICLCSEALATSSAPTPKFVFVPRGSFGYEFRSQASFPNRRFAFVEWLKKMRKLASSSLPGNLDYTLYGMASLSYKAAPRTEEHEGGETVRLCMRGVQMRAQGTLHLLLKWYF